jgi:hypothetical protein
MVTVKEIVWASIAAVPLFAGMFLAATIGESYDFWRQSHEIVPKRYRYYRHNDPSFKPVVVIFLMSLVFHVMTWLLRRYLRKQDRFLELGSTAWTVLFRICYAIGLLGGMVVFITM